MGLSEILNFVLGGSLLATVVGIVTLRATVRKANAEAEKAKADAETVRRRMPKPCGLTTLSTPPGYLWTI